MSEQSNGEVKVEDLKCPDCQGKMLVRTGKFGIFYGCADYPKCVGTRDKMGRSKADREAWKEEQRLKREQEQGQSYELDPNDESNQFSFKRTR